MRKVKQVCIVLIDSFFIGVLFQLGSRKRRIKLVVDREYETSSTGEDSMPETQHSRLPSTLNSHANVNGSIYVAQNGSIIRTRRSVNATGLPPTHTNANNNLKFPSPVFSSRLAKHFKKLDKMAVTLEERVPLNSPRADAGCNTLRTFQRSGMAASASATSSFSNTDNNKTLNGVNTQQPSVSLGSTSVTSNTGTESVASKSNLLKAADSSAEPPQSTVERDEVKEGETESEVDGSKDEGNEGLVTRGSLECPSDRIQSDEEELWMGPWNSLHIPMTKLWLLVTRCARSVLSRPLQRHNIISVHWLWNSRGCSNPIKSNPINRLELG